MPCHVRLKQCLREVFKSTGNRLFSDATTRHRPLPALRLDGINFHSHCTASITVSADGSQTDTRTSASSEPHGQDESSIRDKQVSTGSKLLNSDRALVRKHQVDSNFTRPVDSRRPLRYVSAFLGVTEIDETKSIRLYKARREEQRRQANAQRRQQRAQADAEKGKQSAGASLLKRNQSAQVHARETHKEVQVRTDPTVPKSRRTSTLIKNAPGAEVAANGYARSNEHANEAGRDDELVGSRELEQLEDALDDITYAPSRTPVPPRRICPRTLSHAEEERLRRRY